MTSTELRPVPKPSGYPIVGNLPQLRGDEMLWKKLAELRKSNGDIFLLHLGSLKMLVVCGHRLVKKVLVERADGFKYRPQWLIEVKSLQLNNGMVWSNGLQNANIRKFAMPALWPGLGPQTLEQKVHNEALHLVEQIAASPSLENSDDLREVIYKAVCNIKCAVIFGQRFSYTDPDFIEFMGLMDQMLQRHGVKNLQNFFPILQNLPYSRKTKNLIEVLSKIKSFLQNYVAKAKETFDPVNLRGVVDLFIARTQDVKLQDEPVTEDNLTHICRDLFVAGTENVTCAILWLIAFCLKYNDVMEKCRRNIEQVVGEKQGITLGDVKKMVYVQATINEVLRIANITPLSVPHATVQEEELDGYRIPKQTMVLTHIVSVHNDPDFWEEPETFNPDRFISADGALIDKEAFYPYSLGPRYCIAKHLAEMEISLIFVNFLRNFDIKPANSDQKPTLKPIQPGAFVEPEKFGVRLSRI